jgi:hypothetical protein
MVFWVVVKGVIDVKTVYKKMDSLHFRRAEIKNPGPLGTRGLWDTKSPEGEYITNIENLIFFVNSHFSGVS